MKSAKRSPDKHELTGAFRSTPCSPNPFSVTYLYRKTFWESIITLEMHQNQLKTNNIAALENARGRLPERSPFYP